MPMLVSKPTAASPANSKPAHISRWIKVSASQPPAKVPRMMPTNVSNSRMPFPADNFEVGSTSGMIPYFAGAKMVLCKPIRQIAASCSPCISNFKATAAKSIIAISPNFTPIITERLLKRSAIQPPTVANNRNGTANNSEECPTKLSLSASLKETVTSTGKITNQRSALSENAPWNWVNIKFQKPRGHDFEGSDVMLESGWAEFLE